MRCLGILNWFRPFIKSLSHKIHSFTELLKSQTVFKWTDEHQKS